MFYGVPGLWLQLTVVSVLWWMGVAWCAVRTGHVVWGKRAGRFLTVMVAVRNEGKGLDASIRALYGYQGSPVGYSVVSFGNGIAE